MAIIFCDDFHDCLPDSEYTVIATYTMHVAEPRQHLSGAHNHLDPVLLPVLWDSDSHVLGLSWFFKVFM